MNKGASLRDRAVVNGAASVSALRASVPSADLVTMDEAQLLVLDRMSDELGYPFADIASDTGLSTWVVRAVIRQFHAMGLTGFGTLHDLDGDGLRGRGYWLRKPGWELQAAAYRLCGRQWIYAREASAIDARSGETRQRLDPKDKSAVPDRADAQAPAGEP